MAKTPMLDDILRKLPRRERDAIAEWTRRLTDLSKSDLDLPSKAREAVTQTLGSTVAISALTSALSSTMDSARQRGTRAAKRTARQATHYVAAHPRRVGLGVGTAAVAAVGLFALTRAYEKSRRDRLEAKPGTDASGEAPDPETIPG